MTPNRSLKLTMLFQEALRRDLLRQIAPLIPVYVIENYQSRSGIKRRDRVYSDEVTLLSMIMTALQEDKSLESSVLRYQAIHERNREEILLGAHSKKEVSDILPRRPGRPSKGRIKIQKSKLKSPSLNSAAYSKARKRLDIGLIEEIFSEIASKHSGKTAQLWHGRRVFNTDGTYLQLQDTPDIRKHFGIKNHRGEPQEFPNALVQLLTEQGSGIVYAYQLGTRRESELQLVKPLENALPPNSLLLADDLYNCYWHMALCIEHKIDFIVPDKKDRKHTIVKQIAKGDAIVKLMRPRDIRNADMAKSPPSILVRRIEYPNTQNPNKIHVILTSVLDESISATEIVCKYSQRWDVEISIREIKAVMGFNILRSKSVDMVFKELSIALIAYNLIRAIIAESVKDTDFSPQEDLFQKFVESYQALLIDSKGRIYSKWGSGRPRKTQINHPDKARAQ